MTKKAKQSTGKPNTNRGKQSVRKTAGTRNGRGEPSTARFDFPPLPPTGETTWEAINLGPYLSGNRGEEPKLLARSDGPCLLYRGKVHSISGEPEATKGWLALHACAERLSRGEHVVYIDFEDSAAGISDRLLAMRVDPNSATYRFHYLRPDERLTDESGKDLAQLLEFARPSLVVIDGVTDSMSLEGLNILDSVEVARWVSQFPRKVARTGAAVLVLDHVTKDKKTRNLRYAIGSQHKLAGIDGAAYALIVVRPFGRGHDGEVEVLVTKDRPGGVRQHAEGDRIATLHLRSADGSVALDLGPPEAGRVIRSADVMEKVSRVLEEAREPLSGRQVEQEAKGNSTRIREALALLVNEGYVERRPGPRNSELHNSLKPFRADGDQG